MLMPALPNAAARAMSCRLRRQRSHDESHGHAERIETRGHHARQALKRREAERNERERDDGDGPVERRESEHTGERQRLRASASAD